MGLGWQILAAARARESGGKIAAMVAAADYVRIRSVYLITLDALEYLHRGGRIGGAQAFIGQLLNLKPQISVNHENGTGGGWQSPTDSQESTQGTLR